MASLKGTPPASAPVPSRSAAVVTMVTPSLAMCAAKLPVPPSTSRPHPDQHKESRGGQRRGSQMLGQARCPKFCNCL